MFVCFHCLGLLEGQTIVLVCKPAFSVHLGLLVAGAESYRLLLWCVIWLFSVGFELLVVRNAPLVGYAAFLPPLGAASCGGLGVQNIAVVCNLASFHWLVAAGAPYYCFGV